MLSRLNILEWVLGKKIVGRDYRVLDVSGEYGISCTYQADSPLVHHFSYCSCGLVLEDAQTKETFTGRFLHNGKCLFTVSLTPEERENLERYKSEVESTCKTIESTKDQTIKVSGRIKGNTINIDKLEGECFQISSHIHDLQ